jgi:outer membrane protein assembly factor BamA
MDMVEAFMTPPRYHSVGFRRQRFGSPSGSSRRRGGAGTGGGLFGGDCHNNGGNGNFDVPGAFESFDDPDDRQPTLTAGGFNTTSHCGSRLHEIDETEERGLEVEFRTDSSQKITNQTAVRGGSTSQTQKQKEIVQGSKSAFKRTVMFWKDTVDDTTSKLSQAIRQLWPFKRGGKSRSSALTTQEELLHALETMPIKRVTVPNTTVLPPDVLRVAVKRAGIIGNPLRTDRVQDLAKTLKMWYMRQGYVLHSVTGATLQPDTATAEINVEEPTVSTERPVELVFCKEMVVDADTGELMTFKQFYQRYQERMRAQNPTGSSGQNRLLRRADRPPERHQLNTTMVVKEYGRTNPQRIAQALKLQPGQPFRWQEGRWRRIASSGIFSKVLKTSPLRQDDGGVGLQIICMEPPARHLEYGIGKSIWTNAWEGEVDFDWRNVFGGGESVGVLVRRGTRDAAPSVRFRYADDKFGLEGGYDMEVFSDFIGDTATTSENTKTENENDSTLKADDETSQSSTISVGATPDDYDEDDLLNRRGATFRLRNPISPRLIANSIASASIERTSTKTGLHESIGSATLTLGPFRQFMPMDARSSISTTVTGGTRLRGATGSSQDGSGDRTGAGMFSSLSFGSSEVLPYSSATATARQVIPLSLLPSQSESPSSRQPITLALEHTVTTSTSNIPRHEAKAMGNSCHIRGASPDGPASSSLRGTTELRIPVAGPPQFGTGTIVVFGDWFFVQQDKSSPFYAKSSIGVGIRKNIQGLPLKFDLCYSSEGKIKPHYSLGLDFDV